MGEKQAIQGKHGYCLVDNCKKNNMDVIGIVLGAGTTEQRFSETKQILEYAINNYEIINLNSYIKNSINVRIEKYKDTSITAIPTDKVAIPILKQDKDSIKVEYVIADNVVAPININTVIGYAQLSIGEEKIGNIEYVTQYEYGKNTYLDYMKYILGNYVLFLKIE